MCTFRDGGDNAVQTKGGSADILVEKSRFENAGQRGVNIHISPADLVSATGAQVVDVTIPE